jgi:hypothetical protein
MRTAFAIGALLALLSAAPSALAQPEYSPPPYVSAGDVRLIAGQYGLAVLYRMRLDEGVWKIEGRDMNGRYVYMRINPLNGEVVSLDRGW